MAMSVPGTHGNANIGGGQCGRVIDPVAGHGHNPTLLPEIAVTTPLSLRAALRLQIPQFPSSAAISLPRSLAVAGQHHNTQCRLRCRWLNASGVVALIVIGKEKHALQLFHRPQQMIRRDPAVSFRCQIGRSL